MNISQKLCMLISFTVLLCTTVNCRHATSDSESEDSSLEIKDLTLTEPQEPKHPDTLTLKSTPAEMREFISHSEHKEQYCRGIIPAMIEDVPEYAVKLLKNQHEGFLIVDKATMKIYRYNKYGELQESYGMACSKNFGTKHARRDNRTPEGFFSIEGKYDSTDWLYTDDDGVTSDVKGQFGPRFMRLKVPNTSQIGIHGTCAPWSIGGRRSHGCIRVTNENILKLFDIVQVGWPVIVSPGRKDYAVNMEEGYDIPTVPVIYGKPRALYSSVKTAAVHSDTGEHTLNDSTLSPHDVPVIDSVAVVHPSDSI